MSVRLPGVEATARVRVVPAVIGTKLTISIPETVVATQPFTVSGKLTDEYGNPISGATIELYADSSKLGETKTGTDGSYRSSLVIEAPGEYTIKARFPGITVPLGALPVPIPPAPPRPPTLPVRLMYRYPEVVTLLPSEATVTITTGAVTPTMVPAGISGLTIVGVTAATIFVLELLAVIAKGR
jgi:hypothetical protein